MTTARSTLSEILADTDPTAPALIAAESGEPVSYGELADRVDTLARVLAGAGVSRGDRVCIAVPNGLEVVELTLAVSVLGAAAAPLNPAYTVSEFEFYLSDIQPKLLLAPAGEMAAAREAATQSGTTVVDISEHAGQVRIASERPGQSYEPARPDDVALLLHTSGTTSRPKQVPLRQRNLTASAGSISSHYRLSPADVSYVAMPLFHVHGLVASTLAPLASGGTVVVPRSLTRSGAAQHIDKYRVTWLSAGPTIHHMLLDRLAAGSDLSSLRFVRSCSSALTPELLRRAEDVYGVPMLEAYGMTEASHEMTANPLPPLERRPGTVGIPTGAAVRIVDEEWNEVPPGALGEVTVSGPGLTTGYLGNDEANQSSFRDGWFRTGDQGLMEDGYLRLTGRLKELIIRGGENISPTEVEDVLKAHAAVADAVVFGAPDEKYGEVVVAAVSLAADADRDALIAHCRERLTPVKVPATIHVLDAIPRTATGKLQRRRIADSILGS